MSVTGGFGRYRDLIEDWDSFVEVIHSPLPICLLTNRLRIAPDKLSRLLDEENVPHRPLQWHDSAFRVDGEMNPGTTLSYHGGLYNVQEEVSLLPVVALAPRAGERVLDLCAAPGNKTVQAAMELRNGGTVVANDRSGGRLNVLRTVLYRLGLTNVSTTNYDASVFPRVSEPFDCVIADVPCSCEGTSRKHSDVVRRSSRDQSRGLSEIQKRILLRAASLCRPGGRIVYATCTYAPEENEMVVNAALTAEPGLRIAPIEMPGLVHSPGLTAWEGVRLRDELAQTMRIWPHQNDTGGFYVALLEKAA